MTREAEARSWDETTGNVWHRLAACDHLLDINSWKQGDLPPGQGISFATVTRHLRILRRRIEEILGTSARHQDPHQIWKDISKEQWELLWSGETALRKYGAALWKAGHKTVNFFPGGTATAIPPYHVHNGTRNPETHSQNTLHIRTTKNGENNH